MKHLFHWLNPTIYHSYIIYNIYPIQCITSCLVILSLLESHCVYIPGWPPKGSNIYYLLFKIRNTSFLFIEAKDGWKGSGFRVQQMAQWVRMLTLKTKTWIWSVSTHLKTQAWQRLGENGQITRVPWQVCLTKKASSSGFSERPRPGS